MYYAVKLDAEKCAGCKLCIMSCPDPNVIYFIDEKRIVYINEGRCKGCGLCASVCPEEALSVAQT